jgi:hypothetical protein
MAQAGAILIKRGIRPEKRTGKRTSFTSFFKKCNLFDFTAMIKLNEVMY